MVKTKNLKQVVIVNAAPEQVYDLLMDSRKHSQLTGSKAQISDKVGGKISAYDGYITGKNVKLSKGKKIVQTWHASDWPQGHDSLVTFALEKAKGGTKLTFTQSGIPEEFCDDIEKGWIDYYWNPMKNFFPKS